MSSLTAVALGASALVSAVPSLLTGGVVEAASSACTIHKTITKGTFDGFAQSGVEAASPSATHETYWEDNSNFGQFGFKDYDDQQINEVMAETFDGFMIPAGHEICGATLRFSAKGVDGVQDNDSIGVHFTQPDGASAKRSAATEVWAANLLQRFGPGPIHSGTIDLGQLPNPNGSPTLLPQLQDYGYLDVWVQDDSEVDALELTISTRPLITIDKTTNGLDDAELTPGSLVTWTYTVTNHADEDAVVERIVDDQEGLVSGDRCDPADGVLEPGASMTCTMTGTAEEAEYCNTATAAGVIEGFGEFEIADTSCYRPNGACDGNLITNPRFGDVTASPTARLDEDIAVAAGWSPIWDQSSGESGADLYAPGEVRGAEPFPASGNFAAMWVERRPGGGTEFREGMMNQLTDPLRRNRGVTALTFTTAQTIFVGDATVGVYGVYEGADGPGRIVDNTDPVNELIFDEREVVELGTFGVHATDTAQKIDRRVEINTSLLERSVDRIFITRDDVNGKAYVAFDDFCMQPPVDPRLEMLATPARLMDTRPGQVTADGVAESEGRLRSAGNDPFGNGVYRLPVAGRLGIAEDASAALLNVVAVGPAGPGFLTVFPCNGDVPTPPVASSLNFTGPVAAIANNVTVGLDEQGDVCIFASTETDIVVDVAGGFASASTFQPVEPTRFVDTREDGAPLGADEVLRISLDTPPSLGEWATEFEFLTAVAINLTAVGATEPGFLTAYPCDGERPTASSVNYTAGSVVPNGVVVGVSREERTQPPEICVYAKSETHVLVDVVGLHTEGSNFEPTTPARYLDTRPGGPTSTFDGEARGSGVVRAGTGIDVQVAGRGEVPADATAVSINVTAVRPEAEAATNLTSPGFVTVYPGPCGDRPLASNINLMVGDVARANGAVVSLPESGEICIHASRDLDLVLDVVGHYKPPLVGV